ncbi:DEAD/DEAH box helicase [Arthrobacter sp. NIO-1057]|uniref:DEAD/DEAH box helicase n=1 Tax=Arthrobacter sp. NIO-1057 TaxID=993071 RepID=UPI00071DC651|nr:DEAD/DEAH box helicase [Arthrobacter sp. NIO-1057]KSU64875.1 DEAD/DEAH box helicase [Arthrobacter sp. NIO-1057]SCC49068.1 Superfamily II DNA and RNA helicase [Arthrobacter sp. NIO-1057]
MSVTFGALGVPGNLAKVLSESGIETPFPIQEATLPSTLAGGDVLGRGQTGSGKTLAFSLPLVARLAQRPQRRKARFPRALIMAPTRELATQIAKTVDPLAKATGLRTTVIYGGVAQSRQEKAMNDGVDIVIACPGRLDDLIKQKIVDLSQLEISVLDEADHMADMGFLPVVRRIMDRMPTGIQHMLFSATLDNGVDKVVKRYLSNPTIHSVDAPEAAVNTMEHHVFVVPSDDKKELIRVLAQGTARRIMFMRTKHHAKKMAVTLSKAGVPAVDLHGNLSQNARDRNLAAFASGEAKVLVATDVAARGVHVDGVELVVHIDPPAEHKAYTHRSGRTARAGSDGTVVTICTPEQQGDVASLLKQAGLKVPFEKVSLDSPVVAKVVGEVAEHVPYVAPVQQKRNPAKKKPAGETSNARGGRGGGRNARGGKPAGEAQGRGGDRRRSDRSGASNQSERPARESRGANAERPSRSARGANGERPSNSSRSARSGGRNAAGAAGGRSRGPRRASSPATGGR